MKKIATLFVFVIVSFGMITAQDANFSQFFQTPQLINPALTGTQRCETKVSLQYRNQGQAITRESYSTIAATAEHRLETKNGSLLGFGLMLGNDQSGQTNYAITQAAASLAGHIRVGDAQFFSLGLQGGVMQHRVSFGDMIFDRQFNGTFYDLTLPSGEEFNRGQVAHLDVSSGLAFSSLGEIPFYIGFAMFHVNSPNISFLQNEVNELPWKYTTYLSGAIPLPSSNLRRNSSFVYQTAMFFHGPYNEINFGGGVRTETRFGENSSIYIGGIWKMNDIRAANARDALVAVFNFETNGFGMGVSIDFSTNELVQANSGFSTFEMSLYQTFGSCKEFVMCPRF